MDINTLSYWNDRWLQKETAWDIGSASTPLTNYTNQLINKHTSILIPGCGNAYEAEHLLNKGFTKITLLDISSTLVAQLTTRLQPHIGNGLQIICADFFNHQGKYDLILEQTFFCALPPSLRHAYAKQMHQLLQPSGKITGVLFNRTFNSGPPFGGSHQEYQLLFNQHFTIQKMEACYNSIGTRQGSELFFILKKEDR